MTQYQKVIKIRWQALAVLLAVSSFFLLAAMSLAGADAGIDRGHGLLWEVGKEGAGPAYLFGTIHTEDPDVLRLAKPVQQAFAISQSVVLEMLLDVASPCSGRHPGRCSHAVFRQLSLTVCSRGQLL
jgi:hypothetical protein